ncbi:MAG TPA: response regulator transcription factor [Clostridiales bacterium]|nr:response regulator transcription factor [Clostridiales bacterium]HOL91747.1 response regulator transcription factor [Clostridiales bacterium]HPP35855.1 response regulator transcription factor [Clostridiales bacterium]
MYRILLVEDDDVIANVIREYLNRWGYDVYCVDDFNDVTGCFSRVEPQLVLMDIYLPFCNGYHWCKEIRKLSRTPIMFISSASDNMNIVMAVNMGGDDYIQKPFDLEVLRAKIEALLRRTYAYNEQSAWLEHKGVLFNTLDGTITYQGKKVELTKNEFKIMQLLFENIGKTISREAIMKRLWDDDCFIDDNTLTVNMNRLRKKLEEASIRDFIRTKKGLGYLIESE